MGNLLCGCLSIVHIFYGDMVMAAYLTGVAVVLDFFDGFAARLLNAHSTIGKDLDSLADMVSFGVVPGMMVFKMLTHIGSVYYGNGVFVALESGLKAWYPLAGMVVILFSALRLARFNNDTRQTEGFIGLPTPANAVFICSLPLVFDFGQSYRLLNTVNAPFITDAANLAIIACLLSLLLVTELPMFSLKFRSYGWRVNQLRYLFLLACVLLLWFFGVAAFPLSIVLYIVVCLVQNIFLKKET